MENQTLRTFKHFPEDSICPICGTNEDKECFLIPIKGTQRDNMAEAMVFHTSCLDLIYDKENNIIYQVLSKK